MVSFILHMKWYQIVYLYISFVKRLQLTDNAYFCLWYFEKGRAKCVADGEGEC